jgi:hypothetical protein
MSDISRFWVNDVTLIKVLKIANRKFHDLFQYRRGIHGKNIVLPANKRSTPNTIAKPDNFPSRELTAPSPIEHLRAAYKRPAAQRLEQGTHHSLIYGKLISITLLLMLDYCRAKIFRYKGL